MRITVFAAAVVAAAGFSSSASAVDFGKLFGVGGENHKDCAWSRPHIVFENNTKAVKSYTMRRPGGAVIQAVTVAAGKEEKIIMSEADVVHVNQDTDLVFEECDDKGHYPAYRWTWKKDNSVEIHPRSK